MSAAGRDRLNRYRITQRKKVKPKRDANRKDEPTDLITYVVCGDDRDFQTWSLANNSTVVSSEKIARGVAGPEEGDKAFNGNRIK